MTTSFKDKFDYLYLFVGRDFTLYEKQDSEDTRIIPDKKIHTWSLFSGIVFAHFQNTCLHVLSRVFPPLFCFNTIKNEKAKFIKVIYSKSSIISSSIMHASSNVHATGSFPLPKSISRRPCISAK